MNENTQPHGEDKHRQDCKFVPPLSDMLSNGQCLDQIISDLYMSPFHPFSICNAMPDSDNWRLGSNCQALWNVCSSSLQLMSMYFHLLTSEGFTGLKEWLHAAAQQLWTCHLFTSSRGAARTPGEALRHRRQRSLWSQQAPWRRSCGRGRSGGTLTGSLKEPEYNHLSVSECDTSTEVGREPQSLKALVTSSDI